MTDMLFINWQKNLIKGVTIWELGTTWLTLPYEGGGLLKPPLNKNHFFGTFLCSNWPEKIWLFPNIYGNASHTLLEAQNGLKKGFYSIFVVSKTKIRILKCGFLAFFVAKITKIDIKNQKLIVTNDYQQF